MAAPMAGTTMFARLLQQRVLQLSTRPRHCNRQLLQQPQPQQTSPCPSVQRRMQATCSHHMWQQSPHCQGRLQTTISSNLSSCNFHSLVGTRLLQQDTMATTSAPGASSPIPDPSSGHSLEDAATAEETVEGNETLFEDEHGNKTFIAPSSTESLIFNGIPYDQLPIVNIKATYNNTHVSVADHTGRTVARTSCGTEGFKNAKKGTAIAAQTAAIAAATKALDKGMNAVRVVIKGIGPGRQTSIKGLQMGGLDIISITDNTPVPHNGCRPRKARRL